MAQQLWRVVQADGGQDRDVVRQQLERFRAVLALLFPPFEAASGHVLWVLYGWLEPWFARGPAAAAPGSAGAEDSKDAIDIASSLKAAGNIAHVGVRATQESAGGGRECEAVDVAGAPAVPCPHAATRAGILPEGGGSEVWRPFAGMLHDMVAAAGKGHAQMFTEEQEERKSEIDMLREALHAHKVCIQPSCRLAATQIRRCAAWEPRMPAEHSAGKV